MHSIEKQLAHELNVKPQQVIATVQLIDEGATIPFIARYRKEVTGGLDDTQLRELGHRLDYLREMQDRRNSIINSIKEQGKLTKELEYALMQAENKTRLEDLYLPYKPKRRNKAQIAIEAGLEPLANALWLTKVSPQQEARKYINDLVTNVEEVLDGALSIISERLSENAELLEKLRDNLTKHASLISKVVKKKQQDAEKYADYFDYSERLSRVPSHRALAVFRGKNEGLLKVSLAVESDYCLHIIQRHCRFYFNGTELDKWREEAISKTWKSKLSKQLESELLTQLKEKAELEAINVFASNLTDLLMAAPAGAKCVLGIDPGLRTGSKLAVVDSTGKLLATDTIYPHAPHNKRSAAEQTITSLVNKYHVDLIAIGNGTASRETDRLVSQLIKETSLNVSSLVVSEAGASVYSASELAAKEFPNLDVSLRGAVSIARRLQDPLAELVKIEPKSIGVGQYQHDVNQTQLSKQLDAVIEQCVNQVGVDVNTASAPLLQRVAGLNSTIAQNIVAYREEHGAFQQRNTLKKVARLGPKAFEQSVGFLRVMNGKNPLDASAVHPEAYSVVERIAKHNQRPLDQFIGESTFLKQLSAQDYTDTQFGVPTVKDIIQELDKPGRDPRPEFKTAQFTEGVEGINDLYEGMILEGVVSNVANFGAFVDIGVHQDGLVHISQLSDRFISDPREMVKAGDIVTVKVLEVDVKRKRVSLSMKNK